MLVPILEVCMPIGCRVLRFTDVTGAYTIANTGGWGSPNIATSDVEQALINITYSTGTIDSIDVTDQMAAAISAGVPFEDVQPISGTVYNDQILEIEYCITDTNGTIYSYKFSTLILCNAKCCLDSMLAMLPEKMCGSCEYEKFLQDCLLIKGLITGAECAYNCLNNTLVDEIILKLQRLCLNNNCNCN